MDENFYALEILHLGPNIWLVWVFERTKCSWTVSRHSNTKTNRDPFLIKTTGQKSDKHKAGSFLHTFIVATHQVTVKNKTQSHIIVATKVNRCILVM